MKKVLVLGLLSVSLGGCMTAISPTDNMFIMGKKFKATSLKYTKEGKECVWFGGLFSDSDFTISGIANRAEIDDVVDVFYSYSPWVRKECMIVRGN